MSGETTYPGRNDQLPAGQLLPERAGEADDGPPDTASGLDPTLKVPQTQSGDHPVSVGAPDLADHPAAGLLDQPDAADGKVACPDSLSAIGTR